MTRKSCAKRLSCHSIFNHRPLECLDLSSFESLGTSRGKMFNTLTSGDGTAWETDQLMRMDARRFKEYSDSEAESISVSKPTTLNSLEGIDTLLM